MNETPRPPADMHFGRSFAGHPLEDECPCQKAPCGLVEFNTINPDCDQHHWSRKKTMRQGHPAGRCPGPEAP